MLRCSLWLIGFSFAWLPRKPIIKDSYPLSHFSPFLLHLHCKSAGQAVGQGKLLVCNDWGGIRRLELGGNGRFLEKADCAELRAVLTDIATDEGAYEAMKRAALAGGQRRFLYGQIAIARIEK